MGKMNELKSTQDIVMEILENFPITRNSDNFLYIKVCEYINPSVINKPFWEVLGSVSNYNLPQYETVRRTRQKIQSEHPELCANSNIAAQRTMNEEVFREYARG